MTIYEQYAQITNQIKELKSQQIEISSRCLEDMKRKKTDAIETPIGKFSTVIRKAWIYSKDLTAKELQIKLAKKEEEKNGKAKFTTNNSLRFTKIK